MARVYIIIIISMWLQADISIIFMESAKMNSKRIKYIKLREKMYIR